MKTKQLKGVLLTPAQVKTGKSGKAYADFVIRTDPRDDPICCRCFGDECERVKAKQIGDQIVVFGYKKDGEDQFMVNSIIENSDRPAAMGIQSYLINLYGDLDTARRLRHRYKTWWAELKVRRAVEYERERLEAKTGLRNRRPQDRAGEALQRANEFLSGLDMARDTKNARLGLLGVSESAEDRGDESNGNSRAEDSTASDDGLPDFTDIAP